MIDRVVPLSDNQYRKVNVDNGSGSPETYPYAPMIHRRRSCQTARSAASLIAGTRREILASHRDIEVTAPECPLHVHRVQPSPEFDPGRMQSADLLKTQAGMHADRADVFGITDHRDHLPESRGGADVDQFPHQRLANPLAATILPPE